MGRIRQLNGLIASVLKLLCQKEPVNIATASTVRYVPYVS